jgi:hypothetical protein
VDSAEAWRSELPDAEANLEKEWAFVIRPASTIALIIFIPFAQI